VGGEGGQEKFCQEKGEKKNSPELLLSMLRGKQGTMGKGGL